MTKRDFSEFKMDKAIAPAPKRANVDRVTEHLRAMFGVNLAMKVALPAALAVTCAAQLSAGVTQTVEGSFGRLAPLVSSLVPENTQAVVVETEVEADMSTLFAHLRN